MHEAINIYAAERWHREGKRWTDLSRFFTNAEEFLSKWIEKAQARLDRQARDRRETAARQARMEAERQAALAPHSRSSKGIYHPRRDPNSPIHWKAGT